MNEIRPPSQKGGGVDGVSLPRLPLPAWFPRACGQHEHRRPRRHSSLLPDRVRRISSSTYVLGSGWFGHALMLASYPGLQYIHVRCPSTLAGCEANTMLAEYARPPARTPRADTSKASHFLGTLLLVLNKNVLKND